MSSQEERQKRLSKQDDLTGKLGLPVNKLNSIRIFQLLKAKEVYSAKERMGIIEAGFRKLQEAFEAGGACNENIQQQMEELKRDNEGLRQILSTVDTTVQDTRASLADLRGKVSDKLFKQTAENCRFTKDIRVLVHEIRHLHASHGSVEKNLKRFHHQIPNPHDIAQLDNKLTWLESVVQARLDSSGQRETLEDITNIQDPLRQSLGAFTPRQERFVSLLGELTEASEISFHTTANEDDWGQFPNPVSAGPQPPPKAVRLLDRYNHYSSSYRLKRPRSESKFIKAYLKKIDRVSAWFIQKRLLEEHPGLVRVLEDVERSHSTGVVIFISLNNLRWEQVKNTMRRVDSKELFSMLETEDVELDIPKPAPRFNLRANRRLRSYKF
ncbi:hypothetical protein GGR52DRAFT_354774 [Hypoxylon sp. FL1284]|nr:hypothetical protein GGR52DRAFT_354774 [Hypoxylon sp. FL1284]